MDLYEKLSQSPVFKGISPEEIQGILGQVRTRSKRYKKGQTIAFRDDPCEDLLIVVQGSIRGEMLDFSGKVVEVETIPAPKPIAAAFVFGKKNRFPVDAVANEDVVIMAIPKNSLVRLMQLNPVLLTNYLDVISNKTHFLTERLWFMSFKTIKEKLAHYIKSLLKPGEKHVILPKSQLELSEFFGVSRPSLSRVIGEMEKENVIRTRRREITITDRDKFDRLLD